MNDPKAPVARTSPKSGRPSKFDPDLRSRVIGLAALGVPFSRIAAAVRISQQTLITYRRDNPDFEEEIEAAISGAIVRNLAVIQKAAAKGDVRSATWYLEHVHSEHFARNRVEVTCANGAPLTAAVAIYLPAKDGHTGPVTLPAGDVRQLNEANPQPTEADEN